MRGRKPKFDVTVSGKNNSHKRLPKVMYNGAVFNVVSIEGANDAGTLYYGIRQPYSRSKDPQYVVRVDQLKPIGD